MNKYEQIRVLGEGGYGKAILVKRRFDKKLFVIKEIRLSSLSPKDRDEATKEANVLSSLHSPFIVSFEESFQERGCFYIVMEYCDGGDLSQKIQRRGNKLFTEEEILKDFIQLALAIKYIHDRKILHRDLKAQNVFFMRDGTIKLGDFGIARVLEHTFQLCRTQIGSPYYLSPEICEGKSYNSKTDIWSLGCILYELCTLRHAFKAENMNALLMNIVRGKFSPIPPTFSNELKQLIQRMLTKDSNLRPSINAILATPIIRIRLNRFLDETLSRNSTNSFHQNSPSQPKNLITRPKFLVNRSSNGSPEREQNGVQMEVVPASKIDRGPKADRNAAEIEALIMQNRENRLSPTKIKKVEIANKEITSIVNTKDSYINQQIKNKPEWAANAKSPKHVEIDESTVRRDKLSSKPTRLKPQNPKNNFNNQRRYSNPDGPMITTPHRGNVTPQRSLGAMSTLSNIQNNASNQVSSNVSSSRQSLNPSSKKISSGINSPQRRSVSKLSGKVTDEEYDRIFGIQKREAELNSKKLAEIEKRQKKGVTPVFQFVDDINRRKIQLQRAEIENKRARMKGLADNNLNKIINDEKLIEEITKELDQDPIIAAAERSVQQRCKSNLASPKIHVKQKLNNKKYISKDNKKNLPKDRINNNHFNQNLNYKENHENRIHKSPQESIDDAQYHLQKVQHLADSIRDALLLDEDAQMDTTTITDDFQNRNNLLYPVNIQPVNPINDQANFQTNTQINDQTYLQSENNSVIHNNNYSNNNREYYNLMPNNDQKSFYLQNKELNFPVVSDGDSISYRAEAIRAFLERELGIDKLLEIRYNLMNPEQAPFDVSHNDIEPGLLILAQQLVILDEMILK
ncbi:hypothetical protein TRFO_29690 [Tritrichomonas foetus]|uniref:non-specific serine/threonine protein kinase n=1 Tax=Tritrichomonas foetus TaxID=1144522 RepID=A0A1J4JZV9_9EUKA|nr:hypothetical protein TRFO_29690 [Tritrichomonas foetus]|eukprot:OHT03030.1 hypothetical protein TRFO_29690 [Tritrichomonas foetus]